MQSPKLLPNPCPLNLLRWSLVRKMHHLSPKSKKTKRSVPNPPRLKISGVSWTRQFTENSQIREFLFSHFSSQPHSLVLSLHQNLTSPLNLTPTIHSNLVKINLFWESADHPSFQQGRMVSQTQIKHVSIAKIQVTLWGTVSGFKPGKSSLQLKIRQGRG